jgi:hypothetical protein
MVVYSTTRVGIYGPFTSCSKFLNPWQIGILHRNQQCLSNPHEIFLIHLPQIVIHMKSIFVIILVVDSNGFTLALQFLNQMMLISATN